MTSAPERIAKAATHPFRGLTQAEVQTRVENGDVNDFEVRVGRTYWQIFRYNIINIFNIVLVILVLIVLLSQDYITVLFASIGVVGNSLIGTVQEINAKRKLDHLAELAPREVHVIRDGQRQTIYNREVVMDDLIIVEPGDRLVADGVVIGSDSLELDESHITGESDPVYKEQDDTLVSGSYCIAGAGVMRVTRIGQHSTVNRLSAIARIYKNTLTPTQHKIASIVQFTLVILAIFGPMLFISGYNTGISFVDAARNTIVFVTTLVPQGLILVVILSLTIGAVKISRHQTLIQRVNAVESLANVTVLCFDKTGTITQNQLAVTEVIPLGACSVSDVHTDLQTYLSNLAHRNSTATAIAEYVTLTDADFSRKVREVPFNSMRKWGAVVLQDKTLVLGAPERVLGEQHEFVDVVTELSQQGLRVLAFGMLPYSVRRADEVRDVQPLALIAISDQVREDIQDTLDAFRAQNVALKVISGDNLRTVCAIAEQAGIEVDHAYTGDQLKAMSDAELQAAVQQSDVFARIEPETKRRIVSVLRDDRYYVAMVGDGVNDVPALKEADLAIVMNDGAQISKDVADIVLLNNAMSTLPLAFTEGREITQTIFGTSKMYLTKNFYHVMAILMALFMALPFPISAIQISWAAFATVNLPSGLMAVGLLRPNPIKEFRHDVLDYIFTSGLIGATGASVVYFITLQYLGDLHLSQSTAIIFFLMYGWMIVINTQGIDVLLWRSLRGKGRSLLIATAITGLTTLVASIFGGLFDLTWPPFEIMVLVISVFVLCAVVLSVGMRNRGLLHQFYRLLER